MKAVLISIRPQWCELIASGQKTIEVRKNRPKIDTPFKCYIYCTKATSVFDEFYSTPEEPDLPWGEMGNRKVIGEFVCDGIIVDKTLGHDEMFYIAACLPPAEIAAYCCNDEMYGWHISDLVIYDKPKELSQFVSEGDCDCMNCAKCAWLDKGDSMAEIEDDCNLVYMAMSRGVELKPIFRPPQSWCYVEELS